MTINYAKGYKLQKYRLLSCLQLNNRVREVTAGVTGMYENEQMVPIWLRILQ